MSESKASQGAVIALGVTVIIWAYSWMMAWAVLSERPTPSEWTGIAFIVASLLAVSGIGGRRSPG